MFFLTIFVLVKSFPNGSGTRTRPDRPVGVVRPIPRSFLFDFIAVGIMGYENLVDYRAEMMGILDLLAYHGESVSRALYDQCRGPRVFGREHPICRDVHEL